MPHNKFLFSRKIYLRQLKRIRGIHFTFRELDVISGILNVRGANKIASLLSVAPNTVRTHARNIMGKLGCNSREGIIDFIAQSEEFPLLRDYYLHLLLESEFTKALKIISKLKDKVCPPSLLIVWENEVIKDAIAQNLEKHLKSAGIKAKIRECTQEENHKIETTKHSDHTLIIFLEKNFPYRQGCDSFVFVDTSKHNSYYLLVFEILQKLVGESNLESIFNNFLGHYNGISKSFGTTDSVYAKIEKQKNKLSIVINFLKNKKLYFYLTTCCLGILPLSVGFYFLGVKEMQLTQRPKESQKVSLPSIRSDLAVPAPHFLLYRPEKIDEISQKLKGHNGIQAVALIGPGGAGKTILARQYAHQKKANAIWELNAETHKSLQYSFENLAWSLANTEESKKLLRSLQEIRNPMEKEEKLLQFVKSRLKLLSNWLLIYDNVEAFQDIEKYFPQDPATWGKGEVILTTRNINLKNNSYLAGYLPITELTDAQKLTLFTKIMENEGHLPKNDTEGVNGFLEKIPPYPLDIVVAAYYLKTANISYSEYLESLNQNSKDIALMQEDLLKDAGSYTRTRYSMVILSLKHLMHKHKDFNSLLLFISLLDSQNIPRKILASYKKNFIIDSFIYHLKKYSLITDESPASSLEKTISLHRHTQAIIGDYLSKEIDSRKRSYIIYDIFNAIEHYADELTESEDLSKLQLLATHLEAFLKHNDPTENPIKDVIHAELGNIYYFLGDPKKGKRLLEDSIEALNKPHDQKHLIKFLIYLGKIYVDTDDKNGLKKLIEKVNQLWEKKFQSKDRLSARLLSSLGDMYDSLGNHKKAKEFLQKSAVISKQHSKNPIDLAWTLALLGNVCRKTGNYKEAKTFFEESLFVYKNHISEENFRIGWILIHLGNIYAALGDYKKAHLLMEEGVERYKKYYPEDHPDLAWALGYLGNIYLEVREYTKAKDLLEKVLLIYEKNFLEDHSGLLRIKGYLANAYIKSQNYKEARSILEKVLPIYEQKDDYDPIEVASCIQALAEVHFLENDVEIAEGFTEKALKIFSQHKHPNVFKFLERLSELYLAKSIQLIKVGNPQKAKAFKAQAISFLKQALEHMTEEFSTESSHTERIQLKLKGLES